MGSTDSFLLEQTTNRPQVPRPDNPVGLLDPVFVQGRWFFSHTYLPFEVQGEYQRWVNFRPVFSIGSKPVFVGRRVWRKVQDRFYPVQSLESNISFPNRCPTPSLFSAKLAIV